ncbi:L-2-hydroxyglutarate oxidase [Micromonospora sp. WMMA1363]|uniref:L-2-hydroxyglutarate oxidase n=1 Tax=Micromonospora sp. WMMA1363 TaxID=3053985 RepID=UPI00259CB0BC|nr:L-2-hydroxyglutarate oxidase [Micromonospora sp. WMMA1363]MDM4718570.1 L-2-hydroxyglutarate oxidase [Micromonospora sp. WMMA1363]
MAERIGVIGGGIVGLAVARELAATAEVVVVEKEGEVARHQTGHNSGVAHAGLYYPPGSLKAELCRRGRELLSAYCRERGLPYLECGKLLIARDEREVRALREIERRAQANQVPGLRWLEGSEIPSVEPHAHGLAALHSPKTAIVDFPAVARALADDVCAAGGEVRLSFAVTGIRTDRSPGRAPEVLVRASDGAELRVDRLVVCAGLQSDRMSRLAGDEPGPAIVPFRGEYYRLRADKNHLVRGMIYPVPDPRYPFLGVHLTRTVGGDVEVGPNAVLALAREDYDGRTVNVRDVWETVRWRGFRRLARQHWRAGVRELHGSLSRRAFAAAAATYVRGLTPADVERAGVGVRAQAVDVDGSMVDDFRIHHLGPVVAVRNAPSPAATSALAIGPYIADRVAGSRS